MFNRPYYCYFRNSLIEYFASNCVKNLHAMQICFHSFPWFCCKAAPILCLLASQIVLILGFIQNVTALQFFGHEPLSGSQSDLSLRQNLVAKCLVYGSLNLRISLLIKSTISLVILWVNSSDNLLNSLPDSASLLSILGISPYFCFMRIRMRITILIQQCVIAGAFRPSAMITNLTLIPS